jgi:hypothetical protein
MQIEGMGELDTEPHPRSRALPHPKSHRQPHQKPPDTMHQGQPGNYTSLTNVTAEAAEADQSPNALDRVFGKLDLSKKPDPEDGDEAPTDDD